MLCSIAAIRIDYSNALLFGETGKALSRIERVKKNMARVVFDICIQIRYDSGRRSVDLVREFHWLPVQEKTHVQSSVVVLQKLQTRIADRSVTATGTIHTDTPSTLVVARPTFKNENCGTSLLVGCTSYLERSSGYSPKCARRRFIPITPQDTPVPSQLFE